MTSPPARRPRACSRPTPRPRCRSRRCTSRSTSSSPSSTPARTACRSRAIGTVFLLARVVRRGDRPGDGRAQRPAADPLGPPPPLARARLPAGDARRLDAVRPRRGRHASPPSPLWLFLLTLGWTLMLTPYFAWGAELSGDYAERGRIAVWRETAGLVGTILAAVLYSLGRDPRRRHGDGRHPDRRSACRSPPRWCLARVPEPRDYSRSTLSIGSVFARADRRAAVRPPARRLVRQRRRQRAARGAVPVLRRPAPRRPRPRRPAADPLLRLRGRSPPRSGRA